MSKILYLLQIISSSALLSGCGVWPYKSDFDCDIPKGEQCKSLYEINHLADEGKYTPRPNKKKVLPEGCLCQKRCL